MQVEEDLVMTILEETTEGDEGASRPARREVVVGNGLYQAWPGCPTSDTTDHAWQPLVDELWRTHEGDEGASRPARREAVVGNGMYQAWPGCPTSDTTDHVWQPLVDELWRTHEVSLLAKIANAKW